MTAQLRVPLLLFLSALISLLASCRQEEGWKTTPDMEGQSNPAQRLFRTAIENTTPSYRGLWVDRQGNRGWAVGEGGTIVATADAGATWKPQASATTNRLHSVTFSADGQRGWAVGDGGTIVATADAGATWKPQDRTSVV